VLQDTLENVAIRNIYSSGASKDAREMPIATTRKEKLTTTLLLDRSSGKDIFFA